MDMLMLSLEHKRWGATRLIREFLPYKHWRLSSRKHRDPWTTWNVRRLYSLCNPPGINRMKCGSNNQTDTCATRTGDRVKETGRPSWNKMLHDFHSQAQRGERQPSHDPLPRQVMTKAEEHSSSQVSDEMFQLPRHASVGARLPWNQRKCDYKNNARPPEQLRGSYPTNPKQTPHFSVPCFSRN
jgi:hypothetical protein